MKKFLALVLAVMMVLAVAVSANAEWKPTKGIKAFLGYGAGGTTDNIVRPLFSVASNFLGQIINVENLSGGSGSISWAEGCEAAPDGYSLICGAETCALYDMYDLVPYTSDSVNVLMVIADTPNFLYVRKDSPYETVEDLFNAELAKPGTVLKTASGTVGINATTSAVYKAVVGVDFDAYTADSSSSAVVTVLGGFADFGFSAYANIKDYVDSGDVRILCSNSNTRIIEDIPCITEYYPEMTDFFPLNAFYCVALNPECTQDMVDTYTEALTAAYNDESFRAAMENYGVNLLGLTGQEANDYIRNFRIAAAKALINAGAINKTMADLGLE